MRKEVRREFAHQVAWETYAKNPLLANSRIASPTGRAGVADRSAKRRLGFVRLMSRHHARGDDALLRFGNR